MKTLFSTDVCNKNPTTYDQLVEMMRDEIVSREMIDHRNRIVSGLLSLKEKQVEAHLSFDKLKFDLSKVLYHSHIKSNLWLYYKLNVITSIAYDKTVPTGYGSKRLFPNNLQPKIKYNRHKSTYVEAIPFYSYDQSHGHNINKCRDLVPLKEQNNPYLPGNARIHPY